MINKNDDRTELEFGKGDICINSGRYINERGFKVGWVGYSNQLTRAIGDEGDIKIGQMCEAKDFLVMMEFTQTQSIDEIIKALLIAKKEME